MRVFAFILSFVCSPSAGAVTLGEVGAAAGIAGALQGTAQTQPQKNLDKAKQAIQNYEQVQNQKIKEAENIRSPDSAPANHLDGPAENLAEPAPANHLEGHAENLSEPSLPPEDKSQHSAKEELDEDEDLRDKEEYQDANPVDYKARMLVFYKRKCPPSQKRCNRGAVLTNIKSVIFNYAHTRGSFAQQQ